MVIFVEKMSHSGNPGENPTGLLSGAFPSKSGSLHHVMS
jgi:hypothetical protein